MSLSPKYLVMCTCGDMWLRSTVEEAEEMRQQHITFSSNLVPWKSTDIKIWRLVEMEP